MFIFFKKQESTENGVSTGCNAVVLMLLLRGFWVVLASQPLGLVDYVEIHIYLAGVLGKEDF